MLTALDFLDELLYSPEACWLRDDGAGAARLGLVSYAAFDGRMDVLHVKLPRAGARIVKGEPMGHVELPDRTVPLVAPVSGEVLISNTDLRKEPTLISSDPYGRGYLLEVEGISKDEMDALWDRDEAVVHLSIFGGSAPEAPARGRSPSTPPGVVLVAGPQVSAFQVFEPGRPFASALRFGLDGTTVVNGRLLPPQGNEVFTPDWAIGDTWKVDAKKGAVTRRFQYEVLGDGRVLEAEVWRVRVSEIVADDAPRPKIQRVLHFRVDDFTLAAWDEVSAEDPSAYRRRYNPRGRECWLGIGEAADGFLFDHPRFPVSLDDEARDLQKGESKEEFPISHYVKFRGGLTRIEAEMRADLPREDGRGTERLLSSIIWERGAPWWREAKRSIGETDLVKATLVAE